MGLLVAVIAGLLLLGTRTTGIPLDPDNPTAGGGQAMARVLSDQGVQVRTFRGLDALLDQSGGAGTTVVVTRADLLTPSMTRRLVSHVRTADRLVLVTPSAAAVHVLDPTIQVRSGSGFPGTTPAGCDLPLARGLSINGGSQRYEPSEGEDATTCFRPDGGFGAGGDHSGYLAALPATGDRPETVVVGTRGIVRNADVLQEDQAALGLRTLGHSPQLLWWSVSPTDVNQADAPAPVWPAWLSPVVWMLGLTVLALMLYRGRRLGRLVPEPLPVIVRASETTESRGQLYRKAADTARASAVLRSASRRRLARFLGLSPSVSDAALVEAVATATGDDPLAVQHLLLGPPAPDEATMTRIAQDLSALERKVHHR